MSTELALASLLHVVFNVLAFFTIVRVHRRISIYAPIAWYMAFHAFVFVVVPVFTRLAGVETTADYIGVTFSDYEFIFGMFVVDLALVAYAAGYLFSVGKGYVVVPSPQPVDQPRFRRAVAAATLLVAPLAVYSAYQTVTGFTFTHYDPSDSVVVMEMVNGVAINTNQVGYLVEFKNTLTPLIFLVCVALRFNALAVAIASAYISYRLFLGWQRIHAVAFIAEVVLFYLFMRGRKWPPIATLPIAAVMLPLFTVVGLNRDLIRSWVTGGGLPGSRATLGLEDILGGMDFANFQFLLYILKVVPEYSGTYTFGTQYLQLLTEPVPRMLWAEKPIGPPIELVNLMAHGNFVGLTKSVVGDAWMNLGVLGVVVTMAIVGSATAIAYRKLFVKGGFIAQLAWLAVLPYSIQLFRDGGVVSIARFLIFACIPVAVTALAYRRLKRGSA